MIAAAMILVCGSVAGCAGLRGHGRPRHHKVAEVDFLVRGHTSRQSFVCPPFRRFCYVGFVLADGQNTLDEVREGLAPLRIMLRVRDDSGTLLLENSSTFNEFIATNWMVPDRLFVLRAAVDSQTGPNLLAGREKTYWGDTGLVEPSCLDLTDMLKPGRTYWLEVVTSMPCASIHGEQFAYIVWI